MGDVLQPNPQKRILIDKLEACLSYSGDPRQNTTIVVVPGLGVRPGDQQKKARRAVLRAQRWGTDLNVVTFLYPGHRQEPLSDFHQDPATLARVMEALRAEGIPEEGVGFLAICYGANVLCRYREEHDMGRFAVLIEPLFGYPGLRLGIRMAAHVVFRYLDWTGKAWHWGRKSRVDAGDFRRLLDRPVRLDSLRMPFLTISNQRHDLVFHQGHLREQMVGTDSRHTVIDGKRFSTASVSGYYHHVTEFIQDWVMRMPEARQQART